MAATDAVKVGDPADEATEMGPLISAAHRETVAGFVEVRPLFRGSRPDGKGYWFPCTLVEATNDDRVAREEVFGPVVAVIPFDDEADAIRLANDRRTGCPARSGRATARGAARRACARDRRAQCQLELLRSRRRRLSAASSSRGFGRELGLHALAGYSEVKNVFFSTED